MTRALGRMALAAALFFPPAVHAAGVEFPTKTIRVRGHKIAAEIADTPEAREQGLMFRAKLEDGHGMLFVFDDEMSLAFWMKNTLIPLSIGYFAADKTLIDVQEMVPAAAGDMRPPTYRSAKPAKYALEMPSGWFKKNGVDLGSKLVYARGRR